MSDIEHPDITYMERTGIRRGEYYPDDLYRDEEDEDDESC